MKLIGFRTGRSRVDGGMISRVCILFFAAWSLTSAERPPNILLMLTDDQGWGDLSMHGNPRLETPNLDRLGAESLRFSDFYVNPACAPTRASLLTGRHYHRNNIWGVHGGRDYLDPDAILLPEVLQRAGYSTAMIGKWHNGKTGGFLPWYRGFDDAWVKRGLYAHETEDRDRRIHPAHHIGDADADFHRPPASGLGLACH